jgi:hypothetical protein
MSESRLEAFLAKIYTDQNVRERFLIDPRNEAAQAGLTPGEIESLVNIDRVGLQLFAASLERKKEKRTCP